MWFALIFNQHDELLAAASAADVYEMGRDYWREVYASDVAISSDCQTAYVHIKSSDLIAKLESLEQSDEHLEECRQRVNQLTLPFREPRTTPRPKAA